MPTYEYKCKECDATVTANWRLEEVPCPSGHGQMKRVYSLAGISFKGSGFYKNDSRRK